MAVYDLTCADCGRPMAHATYSLPQGQACCQPCRRIRPKQGRSTIACAGCGGPMQPSSTSLPEGSARCIPCRRIAAGRRPDQRRRDVPTASLAARPCAFCARTFTPRRSTGRYCSRDCAAHAGMARGHRFRTRQPGRTTAAGYGVAHQRARRAAALRHQPTDPCVRCQQPLGPMGRWLHYDHNRTRTGYLGFAHARCNSVAGAREGRRRQHPIQQQRAQSRNWTWGGNPRPASPGPAAR